MAQDAQRLELDAPFVDAPMTAAPMATNAKESPSEICDLMLFPTKRSQPRVAHDAPVADAPMA